FGLNRQGFLLKSCQIFTTFSLVSFAWIFFRARTVREALYIVTHLFSGIPEMITTLIKTQHLFGHGYIAPIGINPNYYIPSFVLIIFLIVIHFIQRHGSIRKMFEKKPLLIRWALYYTLVGGILLFGIF